MEKYSVYVHIFPNGKLYFGTTRREVNKRWRNGAGYRNAKRIHEAIVKYGWNNIQHIVLAENLDEDVAREMEKYLIKKYNSQNPEYGYNTKNGGQVFGEHSQEFLENVRKRMIGNKYCVGRKISQEHIEALRKGREGKPHVGWLKGKKMPEETKKILSEKAKERFRNLEYREKMRRCHADMSGSKNPMYGKKHSDETKRKISERAKGRKASPETIERLRNRNIVPVYQLDFDGNIINEFASIRDAADSVNGNGTNISHVCKHPNKSYRGYRWEYKR